MNEQERSDLEWIKEQHARLERELARLGNQLKQVESKLESAAPPQPAPPSAPAQTPAPKPAPVQPPPIPPIIRQPPPLVAPEAAELVSALSPMAPAPAPVPVAQESKPPPPPSPPVGMSSPQAEMPPPDRSLEMRVGMYWLVRVGIVLLLTGLVLFAKWGYEEFIIKLGPAGKVALMYLVSGLLMGGGTWWQRKVVKPSLKNYAQVLFAGGLASVYFTTYAAHHIETLRVIAMCEVD